MIKIPKELGKYRYFHKKRYKIHKVYTSKRDAQREQARLQLDNYNTQIIPAQLWRILKPKKARKRPVLEYRLYKRKKKR